MLSTSKSSLEKPLKPLANLLKDVNPNIITMFGLIFPVIFFICMVQGWYLLAMLAFVFNGLDMLDGMIARANNKVTKFGGFLDSTVDRFADFVTLVAFGFAEIVSWEVVLPLLLLTYLISYMRSRIELAGGGKLSANVGIIERGERLGILLVGLALYRLYPDLMPFDYNLITLTFFVLIALSIVTVGQRFAFAYKRL